MMIRQNFLQQQQQQQQQSFSNRQQQQSQSSQQQYAQQQQQGYVINPQFYGTSISSSQQSFPSSQQPMQNGFAQPNQFGFPQQVLTAQYIPSNTASQQQLPQMGISFMQPMQTQSSQQQSIPQQLQQQLPNQRQQQISQQSVNLSSLSQQSPQANNAIGVNNLNNNSTNNNSINNGKNNFFINNSSDTSRKSGEKALNNFQEFIQMTQHIGEADLNLEFVKDMYTFKMDTLPSSKEMLDNFQRILSKQGYSKQQKKNWNDAETNLLVWIILKSCVLKRVDFRAVSDELWQDISTMMVGRTEEQCKLKWLSMSKLNLQQQPWSEEEDKSLIKIIKEYEAKNKSNKWSEIAVKLNQLSHKNVFRQGKQCRERWNNHLDPAINRGPWSQEEEVKMLRLVLEKGKRWSEISKSMASSRTENSVKNRFNSLLKKEKGIIAGNAAETQSNQQDLTEYERIQVTLVIEKMETRIRNGFSLVKTVREGQIEEEEEEEGEENELESRSQVNTTTGQHGKYHNNNEGEEDEDDEENDEEDEQGNFNQEEQSISMQSCVIKAEEPLSQNNNISSINRTASNTQSVQQQQQQQVQQSQQYQQPPLRMNNNINKPLLNKNVVQSKNALFQMVEIEAKIKSEQSIHSEQNIGINQGSQIQTPPPVAASSSASSAFQPIIQEIPMSQAAEQSSATIHAVSQQRDDQCNSQNNSPSLFNLGKAQQVNQQAWNRGGGKRMSYMESSVNLPSTPLLNCFRHLETKQSQSLPAEISVKRYAKRSLKREEFEEELARSQLVLMDKSTKEIFVVTPQFIQSKITQDFQRNVAVLNSFMFANQVDTQAQQQSSTNLANQTTFNTNASISTTSATTTPSSSVPNFNSINSAFTPAACQAAQNNAGMNLNPSANNAPTNTNNLPCFTAKDSSTLTLFNSSLMNTPNINTTNASNNAVSFGSMQNGQGSTTSISMFLNSPPLGPSSMTQLNSNQLPRAAAGELTPGLFSYQGGQFNMSTQNLNAGAAYNSPGMFFLQYSNANTPSQQLITQITPQPSAFSPQQQRMINQMPLASMLHASNNLSNAATASWSSQNSSASPQTQTCRYTNSNKNNNSSNSVIQTAAMLNKQLINQDVCQQQQLAKQ